MADTIVVPYNVVPEVDERVACVIVEPVAANMGLVAPAPGFLEGLRRACDDAGALLVFDEVITGFRIGPGGASAQFGVTPDLWCFGKVIGGGLPVGAFGGRRDVLAVLAPEGPVYQAGTLSGNPLATAAGLAVLGAVTAEDYDALARRAARFAAALAAAVAGAGVPVQVPVVGPLVGIFFGDAAVTDYAVGPRHGGWRRVPAASSPPCSSRVSPSRPAPTRPCSPAWPTATTTSTPSSRPPGWAPPPGVRDGVPGAFLTAATAPIPTP